MIAAREVSVTVRRIVSGGGAAAGRCVRARRAPSTSSAGDSGSAAGGRAPATPAARAAPGSRRNSPTRAVASSSSRAPASRNARYRIRRARSSASGSGPSSSSATGPSTTRRGSIARDLIRISWLAIATNADTWPIRSSSRVARASRYASASAPRGTVSTSSWRASISESSRARGPSNAGRVTWVAASGRRPSPNATVGKRPSTSPSGGLVGELEDPAVLRDPAAPTGSGRGRRQTPAARPLRPSWRTPRHG